MNSPSPSLILIGGPTAVGKTAHGVHLARAIDAEVVSADSVQLFRGVEIAAATPTMEEREGIPHHLLGVYDPRETVTAAEFQRRADEAIRDIVARGKNVVVVGGSGLYLKALLYGLAEAPSRDEALRASLEAIALEQGNEALWARLNAVDPRAAATLHPNDRIRVIRALEVITLTGVSILEGHDDHGFRAPRYRFAGIGLSADRAWIHTRIGQRMQAMIQAGLVDEIRSLLHAGVPEDAQPLTAIGPRETVAFIQGRAPRTRITNDEPVAQSEDELAELIATHTRNFARRQLVLFRKESGFRWFDAQSLQNDFNHSVAPMVAGVRAFLDGAAWTAGEEAERTISGEAPQVRGRNSKNHASRAKRD